MVPEEPASTVGVGPSDAYPADPSLRDAEALYRGLIEQIPAISYVDLLGIDEPFIYVSPQVTAVLGCSQDQWLEDAAHWRGHIHPEDQAQVMETYARHMRSGEPLQLEFRALRHDGRMIWIREASTMVPDQNGRPRFAQGFLEDISRRKRSEQLLSTEKEILELVALGTPLDEVLGALIKSLESASPGLLGSVMLLDKDGRHLNVAAAPSIPEEFRLASQGIEIGPSAGSCGTAAYTGRQVIIADIDVHPLSKGFRELALRNGLRASWSTPIRGVSGEILGTFAMYYREPKSPAPGELDLVQRAVDIAAIAIQCDGFASKLKESEGRYRALIEQAPVVTYTEVVGRDRVFHYMSPQIEAWSGFTAEEWISDREMWARLIHPEDRDAVLDASEHADLSAGSFRQEYRMGNRDGSWRWVMDEAFPISTDPDGPLTWHGVLMDINERKLAEERLQEAETRYRTLVEQLPATTYIARSDEGFPLDYISPHVEEITGLPAEAFMNYPELWERRMHPEDRDKAMADFVRGVSTGRPFSTEYRMLTPQSRIVWVRDEAVHLHSASGEPDRIQGVIFDVTERKRAEETLAQSLEALQRTDAERRRLLARLVTAQEEEQRRIASNIHDDAIQKIVALAMRLDMFAADHPELQGEQMFEKLQSAAARSIQSLRHLMFELRPYALDRDGLVAALGMYLAEERELEGAPAYSLHDGLSEEPSDEVRTVLYRIAQEALANARKHASAARVDVSLDEEDGGVLVRVIDDGVGFDADAQPRSAPGHLGFTSMRERAEMAGGWWRVQSAPGRGTTVEFWVPVSTPATSKLAS